MTKKANQNGHGDEILDLMRENDLFAVCTQFNQVKEKSGMTNTNTGYVMPLPHAFQKRKEKGPQSWTTYEYPTDGNLW